MSQKDQPRQYRIGEYAAYMGVTPDFLKHYEQNNLIHASTRPNGYRYYSFPESSRVLECMRLRNYGVTVRDMERMLMQADGAEAWQQLEQKAQELERRVQIETALLQEHRRIQAWMQRLGPQGEAWQVMEVQPFYFLPHTNHDDFIRDGRIYELLNQWLAWMPLVKSALQICGGQPEAQRRPSSWGLWVPKAEAKRWGIPCNDVVQRVPGGKMLLYDFSGQQFDEHTEADRAPGHPVYRHLQRLGLRQAGPIYKVMVMYAQMGRLPRQQYGTYFVPVQP